MQYSFYICSYYIKVLCLSESIHNGDLQDPTVGFPLQHKYPETLYAPTMLKHGLQNPKGAFLLVTHG